MTEITIAGRRIGPGHAPFIIAECGINDGGIRDRARELIDAAIESGCDAVKWQTHVPWESDAPQPWQSYQTIDHAYLCAWQRTPSIRFGFTAFHASAFSSTTTHAHFLKIGSGEVSNDAHVAATAKAAKDRGCPVLLSTGMHTLAEVDTAVTILRIAGVPFAVLECTSTYPARHGEVRLRAIAELAARYPDAVIGISDHTPDIWTALGAVALGACIVEKHFTVSRAWGGPDNPFSVEPAEMAQLTRGAAAIHAAMGEPCHRVSEAEAETARWARHGLWAARDIAADEALTADNVAIRRPAGLTSAGEWFTMAGLKADRAFKVGEPIE